MVNVRGIFEILHVLMKLSMSVLCFHCWTSFLLINLLNCCCLHWLTTNNFIKAYTKQIVSLYISPFHIKIWNEDIVAWIICNSYVIVWDNENYKLFLHLDLIKNSLLFNIFWMKFHQNYKHFHKPEQLGSLIPGSFVKFTEVCKHFNFFLILHGGICHHW